MADTRDGVHARFDRPVWRVVSQSVSHYHTGLLPTEHMVHILYTRSVLDECVVRKISDELIKS